MMDFEEKKITHLFGAIGFVGLVSPFSNRASYRPLVLLTKKCAWSKESKWLKKYNKNTKNRKNTKTPTLKNSKYLKKYLKTTKNPKIQTM